MSFTCQLINATGEDSMAKIITYYLQTPGKRTKKKHRIVVVILKT